MASFDTGKIKKIDPSTKDLVNGYFREYENFLLETHDDNQYYNIPRLSIYITLTYFSVIEHFELVGNDIILSEDKTCVTKKVPYSWGNSNYGKITINPSKDKGIYQWYIQIKVMQLAAYIGFESASQSKIDSLFGTNGGCNYSMNCYAGYVDGVGYDKISSRDYVKLTSKDFDTFKSGDIICLEFNMNDRNIKFYINGIDHGIAFKSEEIKDDDYRFAVALCDEKDSIKLMKFVYKPC